MAECSACAGYAWRSRGFADARRGAGSISPTMSRVAGRLQPVAEDGSCREVSRSCGLAQGVQRRGGFASVSSYSPIRAPRGSNRTAKGWIQEAAKRMLMNNLDPEVAERPDELIVYGGRGKAARNWEAYGRIVATLERLENDETLLVQSGKPVAVFRTQPLAPRVLIANSNLVPKWATWEEFDRLDRAGLMMYGQMTAGSWIYIGTQGILQGTYETFKGAAEKYFNGSLRGTISLTAGLGGMGGAQPLAVKLAGGVSICLEVDRTRIQRRLDTRYLDEMASSLEDAIARAQGAKDEGRALSI